MCFVGCAAVVSGGHLVDCCIRADDFLGIKYTKGGEPHEYVFKLTVPELAVVESNSAILQNPATVMENIALLLYGEGDVSQALEA